MVGASSESKSRLRRAKALATFIVALVVTGMLSGQPLSSADEKSLATYSVNEVRSLGLTTPMAWTTSEPKSPLADHRIVIYGPRAVAAGAAPILGCDFTPVASLNDLDGGTDNWVNIVLNRSPRLPYTINGIGAKLIFSNLNYEGARPLRESAYTAAVAKCKAAMTNQHLVEPIFVVKGLVRKVNVTATYFGGMMTFHPSCFVILAEGIEFAGTQSVVKQVTGAILSIELRNALKHMAQQAGQQ